MTTNNDQKRIDVASALTDIVSLYSHLPAEAIARAAKTAEFPGDEATNLLGPVANLEAWNHKYDTASEHGFTSTPGDDYASAQIDGENHPRLILIHWADTIRDARDQPLPDNPERTTIGQAARYLRHAITWVFDTRPDGSPNFPPANAMLRDLNRVRTVLENVLHEGWRPEYGAPCLHCRAPLARIHNDKGGFTDDYRCSACGRMYLKDQYEYAIGVTYLAHAPALTASQIETREGIAATRIRVWGSRYPGIKASKTPEGLWLYDVAAVIAKRDQLDAA